MASYIRLDLNGSGPETHTHDFENSIRPHMEEKKLPGGGNWVVQKFVIMLIFVFVNRRANKSLGRHQHWKVCVHYCEDCGVSEFFCLRYGNGKTSSKKSGRAMC